MLSATSLLVPDSPDPVTLAAPEAGSDMMLRSMRFPDDAPAMTTLDTPRFAYMVLNRTRLPEAADNDEPSRTAAPCGLPMSKDRSTSPSDPDSMRIRSMVPF